MKFFLSMASLISRFWVCILFFPTLDYVLSQNIHLTQPPNGLQHQNPLSLTFQWEGDFEYYRLFIGNTNETLSPFGDSTTIPEIVVTNLNANQTYYWRIVGFDSSHSDTTETYHFSTYDALLSVVKANAAGDAIDTVGENLIPSQTALVLVDFVQQSFGPDSVITPSMQNAMNLIEVCRRRGILVVHAIHDYDSYIQPLKGEIVVKSDSYYWLGRVYKVIDDDGNIQLLDNDPGIESYLKNMGINNLLYFGFSPAECVLFTRYNAAYNIEKRNPGAFNIVLVGDCSETDSIRYLWSFDVFRSKYALTNLNCVTEALDDSVIAELVTPIYNDKIILSSNNDVGGDLKSNSAFIVIGPSRASFRDSVTNVEYEKFVSKTEEYIAIARYHHLPLLFIRNGSDFDNRIGPLPGDLIVDGQTFSDEQIVWDFLSTSNVEDIYVAGVISNSAPLFPMADPASLTLHRGNSYYNNNLQLRTFFLRDCIFIDQPIALSSKNLNKEAYLYLATYYFSNFSVSTVNIFERNTNVTPTMVSINDTTLYEDDLFKYQVLAYDPDSILYKASYNMLRYELVSAPGWLTIDSMSGEISGLPVGANVGDTIVVAGVRDNFGARATQQFTLQVIHTNHAPIIYSVNNTTSNEDSLFNARISARDVDSVLFGDQLRYYLSAGPNWLMVDSVSGSLFGIPNAQDVGDTNFIVKVTDNKGGEMMKTFVLHVLHTNHSPFWVNEPDSIAKEDSAFSSRVLASDVDSLLYGDYVHYAVGEGPSWLAIDSATGILTGVPPNNTEGSTVLSIIAYDQWGGSTQKQWNIRVLPTNYPPVFVIGVHPVLEDTLTLFKVPIVRTFSWISAKDPDLKDTLQYTFELKGGDLDTVISGIRDTSVVIDGSILSEKIYYTWSVSVSDGEYMISSPDSFQFLTTQRVSNHTYTTIPTTYLLYQNYPNPFNPLTMIRFQIPEESKVKIEVYNILGQLVQVIFKGTLPAKYYEMEWKPYAVASGIYFVKFNAEGVVSRKKYQSVKKMSFVK